MLTVQLTFVPFPILIRRQAVLAFKDAMQIVGTGESVSCGKLLDCKLALLQLLTYMRQANLLDKFSKCMSRLGLENTLQLPWADLNSFGHGLQG
ncbi:hypothetical protein D3C79_917690 [compost metagenome]